MFETIIIAAWFKSYAINLFSAHLVMMAEESINYIVMAYDKISSRYDTFTDHDNIAENVYTIIVFSETTDEQQIEAVKEITLEGNMEMATEICASLSRQELRSRKKSKRCEMRGVIYENGVLADMMFDPQWRKWRVIATANHPWRYSFPEYV